MAEKRTTTRKKLKISPVHYTKTLAKKICIRIADNESMRVICRDPDMPSMTTIFKWLIDHPEFALQYQAARNMQANSTYEDISNIERKVLSGEINPKAARVVIDSMKWRAGRMLPKKYGDFQSLRLSGPDDGPVKIDHRVEIDTSEIDAIIEAAEKDKT